MRDAARFIASLTAVYGTVVLTDTLRIIMSQDGGVKAVRLVGSKRPYFQIGFTTALS